ncbi:MAG: asparaginase [Bdellovibrionia bacterium]
MLSRNPLVVEITRGPVVESSHQVMAVVCDSHGRMIHSWGNHNFLTMPRSSIKMLQAIPLVESGALDKFDLTSQHLALACASHRGEKLHIDLAKEWLKKISLNESDLVCGGHFPYNEKAYHEFIKLGTSLSPVYSNCVGKHLAMLTTALHLKENIKNYDDPNHPVQQRIRKALSEVYKLDISKVPHGIDGCNVPTVPVPLQNIAIGLSVFMSTKETELRRIALKQIFAACVDHPEILSGNDDFAFDLMKALKGKVVLKGGAEGVYAGVAPEKGVSFALKVADGASRAAQFTAIGILKNMGVLTETDAAGIQERLSPNLKNSTGKVVGLIRFKKE